MIASIVVLVVAVVAYAAYSHISGYVKNIALAKKSGLPYVVAPCSPFFLPWQITHKLWMPIIKSLPRSWWEDWLDILIPDWSYKINHEPFARHGETFLVVSSAQILLNTNSAEAIHQITQQREKYPKLTETYDILKQFGDNVLTTEGAIWRMHRKVTSASFNEKNAALVFAEAIKQAQSMAENWMGSDGKGDKTIRSLDHDTMRLALNIIGYVGFGLRMLWPGQTLPAGTDPKVAKYATLEAPHGHSMSFTDAVAEMLEHILVLLIVPGSILKLLPFKYTKVAAESHQNYKQYMEELMNDKMEDLRKGNHGDQGMDLMGQLVRTQYDQQTRANGHSNGTAMSKSRSKDSNSTALLDSEITGNAFIMLVAGHETTANVMHFSLIELACNPSSQRQLQRDVDKLFGTSDPETWNYEKSVNPMMASMLGACMNETLRMFPPVVDIPKKVNTAAGECVLSLDGKKYPLSNGMNIMLVGAAAHRNPRNWPSRPSKISDAKHDLNDYVPDRWYRTGDTAATTDDVVDVDTEDYGGYQGPDTSAQMFRPPRGSYIPFSDGARSCLGKRIAQVEIIAALGVIFQKYSLELAVDEWASDEEVANMSEDEKAKVYKKAQDATRDIVSSATSMLTLKLHGSHVPVRLVPRGQERFVSFVDQGPTV